MDEFDFRGVIQVQWQTSAPIDLSIIGGAGLLSRVLCWSTQMVSNTTNNQQIQYYGQRHEIHGVELNIAMFRNTY